MTRSIALSLALATWLATPAEAQQLTEQEARQVIQRSIDQFDIAAKEKDAAGIAARYTEDAVRVIGSGGVLLGRAAIEKWYSTILQSFDEEPLTVNHVKVVSDNVIVAVGGWSGTWHGESGAVHMAGRWEATNVLVGGTWKIAANMASIVPQK